MRHWPILLTIFCLCVFLSYSYFLNHKSYILSPIAYKIDTPTIVPTPTLSPPVTVGFVGDLGLGRHITSTARAKKDFSWSFQGISSWLLENNFTVANLESPIIKNCPRGETGTFTFCGDDGFVPYLAQYKFYFDLHNNHILNYGQDGLLQTQKLLDDQHIPNYYDDLLIKDISNLKFGFLSYDFITYPETGNSVIASPPRRTRQSLLDQVSQSKEKVDYLIVSIHWGNEYLPQAETWRVNLAHQLVDAGADIIHGHHPHVWQGVENYQGKLIFYSFGNFIFDQSWSYETSHSQIARVTFQKGEPLNYKLFPIEIKFNSQPWLMP